MLLLTVVVEPEMPRYSERAQLLNEVEALLSEAADHGETPDNDEDLDDLMMLYQHALQQRYLKRERADIEKRNHNYAYIFEVALRKPSQDFPKLYRITKDEFEQLLEMIQNDPVFQSTGRKPQAPAKYQLLVTLYRLGKDGSASVVRNAADRFAIGGERDCDFYAGHY